MDHHRATRLLARTASLSWLLSLSACGHETGSTPLVSLLLDYSRTSTVMSVQIQVVEDQAGPRCSNLMQAAPDRQLSKTDIDSLRSLFTSDAVRAYQSDVDPAGLAARRVGYQSAPAFHAFVFKDASLSAETQNLVDTLESFAATKCP